MDALLILVQNPTTVEERPPALRVFSDQQLLKLKTAFVEDTIHTCAQLDGVDVKVAVAPPERAGLVTRAVDNLRQRFPRRRVFAELAERLEILTQHTVPLASRMQEAISHCFAAGYGHVLAVGGYNPTLPHRTLALALRELRHGRVVLGPTLRGGLYLIGTDRDHPDLFADISADTDHTYRAVCESLDEAGLAWVELDLWYDITHQEDIEFVIRDINQFRLTGDEESARATEEVLAQLIDQGKNNNR